MKALTIAMGLAAAVSHQAANGDAGFLDKVLQTAHEGGYTFCDAAVKKAFAPVGGDSIEVEAWSLPETRKDSFKLTATVVAQESAPAVIEATFRKIGDKCAYQKTITLALGISCDAQLRGIGVFAVTRRMGEVTFAENSGGSTLKLISSGPGCVAIAEQDGQL